jgi:hypothetical protein
MISLDSDFISSVREKYGSSFQKINLSANGLSNVENIGKLSSSLNCLNLSNNNLQDIRPLSVLTTLEVLNLSQNCIADVSPLSALTQLKWLNLSGNNIDAAKLDSLTTCLKKLTKLEVLLLDGNPMCSRLSRYPNWVFEQQNSLQFVDEWDRAQLQLAPIPATIAASIPPSPPLLQQHQHQHQQHQQLQQQHQPQQQQNQHHDNKEIRSLTAQIEAMHEAFRLQEKSLALSAASAAATAAASSANPAYGAETGAGTDPDSRTATDPAYRTGIGSAAISISSTDASKPYTELLELWRKKACECMVGRGFVEKRLEAVMSEAKKERTDATKRIIDLQRETQSWKQMCQALEEKCEMVDASMKQLQESCTAEKTARAEAQATADTAQRKVQALWAGLSHVKTQLDNQAISDTMHWKASIDKMDEQERRITAATDRVTFCGEMQEQKDVALRNSEAVLEVLQSLLHISFRLKFISTL